MYIIVGSSAEIVKMNKKQRRITIQANLISTVTFLKSAFLKTLSLL